jgi:hypothetical protein
MTPAYRPALRRYKPDRLRAAKLPESLKQMTLRQRPAILAIPAVTANVEPQA